MSSIASCFPSCDQSNFSKPYGHLREFSEKFRQLLKEAMECVLSGNQIKSLNRAVNCLYRIGSELLIEVLPDKLTLRTLNTAWSAFLSVTFKGQFFDAFHVPVPNASCSVLLKSVCTVFRTPPGSMERLTIILADKDATKLQWTIDCFNGMRKTYWITCNNDTEMQNVLVERNSFPSHLVVKPRDLGRLLAHFQSSLQEITLIATEPISSQANTDSESKAIELKSYIDPARDANDGALHTQLWIDPSEELAAYTHRGAAVDVTFSVKELKAFMGFCEGAEADMHMYFEKAGKPVLLAPRFGLDDSAHADFDATLVLATMMTSQLHGAVESTGQAHNAGNLNGNNNREDSQGRATPTGSAQRGTRTDLSPGSAHRSDETAIWSELSGSAGRTSVSQPRPAPLAPQNLPDTHDGSEEVPLQRQEPESVGRKRLRRQSERESSAGDGLHALKGQEFSHHESTSQQETPKQISPRQTSPQDVAERQTEVPPQPHTTMWDEYSTDEDDDDTGEFCVPTTPPELRGPY